MRPTSKTTLSMLVLLSTALCSNACGRKATSQPTKVTVIGEADLSAAPDAAVMIFSVVTQGSQALAAQQQNAGKIDTVIKAVKELSGADGEVKTVGYTLQPQNDYRDNKLPKIVGYEARNSLRVMTSDLNKVGEIIDAATRAGANSIDGVSFILKNNSAVSGQVLATATSQAMAKAHSIAEAMGGRVARVVDEQETGQTGVALNEMNGLAADSITREYRQTRIQVGPIKFNSRVQLIVEVDA